MQLFHYKAINLEGKTVSGRAEASNEDELNMRLSTMGLEMVAARKVRAIPNPFSKHKITRRDLIDFCFYFEQMIRAGVPVVDALMDVRSSMQNPQFKSCLSGIVVSIQTGKTLSEAMADYPLVFDDVFVNLIRVGEFSGELNKVLRSVTDTLKWQDELIAQTKKVATYPLVAGSVVTGVVFFLMIYLVPQLIGFIKSMGHALPLHTLALIAVSNFLIHYWYVVLITPVALFLTVKFAAKKNIKVRFMVDDFKLRIWLIGPILRKIIISRFTNYFALLYSSGVTVLECMEITEKIAGNLVVAAALAEIRQEIANGKGMGESFEHVGLFPPLVVRMIKVGESTGGLDEALQNVCYFYNRDVKESIEKLQAMIEPIMTVTLGAVLGWVMLSVLGPIYDLISKIKT